MSSNNAQSIDPINAHVSKILIEPKGVDQKWTVMDIVEKFPPRTWEDVFKSSYNEFETISEVLDEYEEQHGLYFPLKCDIFNAFHYTPLHKIKVVILGQDPYPQYVNINNLTVPKAHGLCFSIRPEDGSIPLSLRNIYKELQRSIPGFKLPDHGHLVKWARQGVLMLNTCLTLKPGKPNSHGTFWLAFISRVFQAITNINPNCIYLLWGREAQNIKTMLGEKNIIYECPHPRVGEDFIGCNHFSLVNQKLKELNKPIIDWNLCDEPVVKRISVPISDIIAQIDNNTFTGIIEASEITRSSITQKMETTISAMDKTVSTIPTIPTNPTIPTSSTIPTIPTIPIIPTISTTSIIPIENIINKSNDNVVRTPETDINHKKDDLVQQSLIELSHYKDQKMMLADKLVGTPTLLDIIPRPLKKSRSRAKKIYNYKIDSDDTGIDVTDISCAVFLDDDTIQKIRMVSTIPKTNNIDGEHYWKSIPNQVLNNIQLSVGNGSCGRVVRPMIPVVKFRT